MHRLFTDEDSAVHYLAVLNPDSPDMFVLLFVDENNDSAVSIAILESPSFFKGATSRYFELFFGSLKIVANWKETFK